MDFEILLVDNGSTKPISSESIGKYANLPINLINLERNLGFAAANNYATSLAKGNYLVLLNADAFPKPDWLENINKGIQKHPNCFFTSKQIMANHPDRLDGMGDVYHISGLVWRKSYNVQITDIRDEEREVFSACAAAAAYPREAFVRVGGFDEDYFSYVEDIDLGFRLRLIGYRCIYLPNAVVYHVGYGSTSRGSNLSTYYGQRNLVWTFIKDMPGIFVWILAPFHLVANLLMIVLGIFKGSGVITVKAKWDALLPLANLVRKRKQVQRKRSAPIRSILLAMDLNPISPLINLLNKI